MPLKNQWVNEEINKEIKNYLETNDNEDTTSQKSMGCCESSAQREIYSNPGLSPKRRSQIDNLTLHLNELEKEEQGVPVVAQQLTNPTRNHEVAGPVPALAQWVNDPALP